MHQRKSAEQRAADAQELVEDGPNSDEENAGPAEGAEVTDDDCSPAQTDADSEAGVSDDEDLDAANAVEPDGDQEMHTTNLGKRIDFE